MKSPPGVRVRVDAQGADGPAERTSRGDLSIPGQVPVRRTADGLLLTPSEAPGIVRDGDDGLPVLTIGRRVSKDETLKAIEQERADR